MANLNAYGFESIGCNSKVQRLNSEKYYEATKAFISVDGAGQFRYDGGEPTPSQGHSVKNGSIVLTGTIQILNFRFISTGDEFSALNISYEKE